MQRRYVCLGPTAARYASASGEARTIVAQGRVWPLAQQDFEAALGLDRNFAVAELLSWPLRRMQAGSKEKASRESFKINSASADLMRLILRR